MPRLNGTGPDGDGPRTGRKLGRSSNASTEEELQKLGKGMGRKKNTGGGAGKGKGKRLKSGLK